MKPAKLVSLATAVPPHVLRQDDVAEIARRMFSSRYRDFDRMAPVFGTSGIDKRHSARPPEWFCEPHGWKDKTAAYLEGAQALFVDAAGRALEKAGLAANDVDVVVTVSSTGIATPSLEARVFKEMGFKTGIQRVPVFGLGCAGGVSGLAIASRLAQSQPGATVLLVVVELCTLAFRLDQLTKANIVATALFGDGAAACILQTEGAGLAEVEACGEHIWPDTLDIMGWNVDALGFEVVFAQAIPSFAEANLTSAVSGILERHGIRRNDIDRFVFHPGGAKVIEALEKSFAFPQGSLDQERAVLREYGNMSAPTVLFVLERVLASGLPPRVMLTSLGPGFTVACASLKRTG